MHSHVYACRAGYTFGFASLSIVNSCIVNTDSEPDYDLKSVELDQVDSTSKT